MAGPDQWGPHGWKFIHYVTMGYPDKPTKNDMIKYKKFLISIGDILPCVICSNHYKQNLNKYPINNNVLKNNKNLMAWGVNVHNSVNKENNKKMYSVKDGLANIIDNDDTCVVENFEEPNNHNSIIYITPVIIFGIILLYQLYKIYYIKK